MTKIPPKLQPWFDARRRFKLSDVEKQQPWKLPLREFIAECYFKRCKRVRPEHVWTLEQLIDADDVRRKPSNGSAGTRS
jgi:hypothetical protein